MSLYTRFPFFLNIHLNYILCLHCLPWTLCLKVTTLAASKSSRYTNNKEQWKVFFFKKTSPSDRNLPVSLCFYSDRFHGFSHCHCVSHTTVFHRGLSAGIYCSIGTNSHCISWYQCSHLPRCLFVFTTDEQYPAVIAWLSQSFNNTPNVNSSIIYVSSTS